MNQQDTTDLGSKMFYSSQPMRSELSKNITIHLPPLDDDLRIIDEEQEDRIDRESITSFFSGNFVAYSFGDILSDTAGSPNVDSDYECPAKTSRKSPEHSNPHNKMALNAGPTNINKNASLALLQPEEERIE